MGKKEDNIANREDPSANVWRTGYAFALLLLLFFGASLIVIGAVLFPQGSLLNVALVGTGMSMAPAAIVAALFRVFLFKEVKYQLTYPVIEEVKEKLGPEIQGQVQQMMALYRHEIAMLQSLRDAGVLSLHRYRGMALKDFASAIDTETSEIMIVGSSLKGLLQKEEYKEIADKLKFKVDSGDVKVKFLLTHPVVADLRAGQEARRVGEIGTEIIDSLLTLKKWGVKPEFVRLYKGTPTCFAIKTARKMLLNPYPYAAVAYDSPCLIVETDPDHPSYFYEAFNKSHFGAWDTNIAARIFDYEQTIHDLQTKLTAYSKIVADMLNA